MVILEQINDVRDRGPALRDDWQIWVVCDLPQYNLPFAREASIRQVELDSVRVENCAWRGYERKGCCGYRQCEPKPKEQNRRHHREDRHGHPYPEIARPQIGNEENVNEMRYRSGEEHGSENRIVFAPAATNRKECRQ